MYLGVMATSCETRTSLLVGVKGKVRKSIRRNDKKRKGVTKIE